MKTYYIESLGCAKNLVDSEAFAHIFRSAGYQKHPQPEGARIVLLNTCGFLESALSEAMDVLVDIISMKAEGTVDQIIVTGCAVQRAGLDLKEEFPEVDLWIDLKDFRFLAAYLGGDPSILPGRIAVEDGFHAYLRISDGCSNHCSYCTIPSIRGELCSIPIPDLVAQAEALAADPARKPKELIVIAQDTCNYGMDIYGYRALPELLEKLHAIEAFDWIRVMYMHPDHFDTAWLDLWDRLPRLLPYFEIPVQHSVPSILRSMGRVKADRELKELFATIPARIPHAILRTTIISGYPGETRQDFAALQRFIREVRFTWLGVFPFSAEAGTPADTMPDQVSRRVTSYRQTRLMNIQSGITQSLLEPYAGREIPVLVERPGYPGEDADAIGRAWFQAPDIDGSIYLTGKNLKPGSIVTSTVQDVIAADLFGTVTSTNPTDKGFS